MTPRTGLAPFAALLLTLTIQASPAKVVAPVPAIEDRFGWSVAVEGSTLVAGAPQDFQPGGAGVAHVFVRILGNWIAQSILAAPDPQPGATFGSAVAIDGNLIAIGATGEDTAAGLNAGAVHIFARNEADTPADPKDDTWAPDVTVTPADASAFDLFGVSVDLDDGLMVAGAWGESTFGNLAGSAYVFRQVAGVWVQEAKLFASDAAAGGRFGVSVAIDGDWLVVGASGDTAFHGAAYVFERVGSSWVERAKLAPSPGAGAAQFGRRVAIEADTIAVSATEEAGATGRVYVFHASAAGWTLEATLVGREVKPTQRFGSGLSLSGRLLAAGAQQFPTGPGAAFLWEREGRRWTERGRFVASDGVTGDAFGFSVSLDYFRMAVGAPLSSVGGDASAGAGYVFDVLTPQEQIDALIDDVQDLVESDRLRNGQGMSLLTKLKMVLQSLTQDNLEAAIQQLQSFVRQIEAFAGSGLLPPLEASALVAAANALIARLQE